MVLVKQENTFALYHSLTFKRRCLMSFTPREENIPSLLAEWPLVNKTVILYQ